MNYIIATLAFILIIGILIVVHEWGHFLVGRWVGARIDSFSIGFGPALYSWTGKDGTLFRIAAFPLGGYVKFRGEHPSNLPTLPGDFHALPVWKRSLVVLAGPGMNLLCAFTLAPLLYLIGIPEPAYYHSPPLVSTVDSSYSPYLPPPPFKITAVNGKEVATWEDLLNLSVSSSIPTRLDLALPSGETTSVSLTLGKPFEEIFFPSIPPVIKRVVPGMPAEKAGIKGGDRILAINGKPMDWVLLTDTLRKMERDSAQPQPLRILVERDGKQIEFEVTPRYDEKRKQFLLGIERQEIREPHTYPLGAALVKGVQRVYEIIELTLVSLYELVFLRKGVEQLGGPIAIAQGVYSSHEQAGFFGLLFYLVFLSIQLAIFNLLPIPILDGGHVVLLTLEALVRRPLPFWLLTGYQWIGLVFLFLLLTFVTKLDLQRMLQP